MDYKRARTTSQVEDRMNEIVKVAIKIYEENGLGKMNFLAISKQTLFTRPTIYKYFNTKEEIMLKMIIFYAKKLLVYIENHLDELENKNAKDVADVLTDAFFQVPEFMELYTILFSVIRKNASDEAFEQFEKDMSNLQDMMTNVIKKVYRNNTDEDVQNFIVFYLAFASGLHSMLGTADKYKESTTQPRFEKPFKSILMIYLQNIEK